MRSPDLPIQDVSKCYPTPGDFSYTFHISRAPALLYVNNPKCGCTTAKASLNRWYAARHNRVLEYTSMADVHSRAFNLLLTPNQVGAAAEDAILRDPTFFRMTLLREPMGRLASAYASKLAWDSSERRRFNQIAGRPTESPLSYADFVSLIHEKHDLRNLNEHWRPQVRQTASAFVMYNYICLQETLDADLLVVRDLVFPGIDLGVFETRKHFPGTGSASAEVIATMGPREVRMIENAYEADFILYESVRESRVRR